MNVRLLSKLLGVLSMLIGGFMLFSLPWAFPHIGRRTGLMAHDEFEASGFWALLISTVVCLVVGGLLYWVGRRERGRLFRKEAMAVVGLGWILATVLGALPYRLSETHRGPAVRVLVPRIRPR